MAHSNAILKSGSFLLLFLACALLALPAVSYAQKSKVRFQGYELTDLGTLGGASSGAWSLSNTGTVVGWALEGSGERRAFVACEGCEMANLGTLPFGTDSAATSISRNGKFIAGYSITQFCCQPIFGVPNIPYPHPHRRGFSWTEGEMTSIGGYYFHATPSVRRLVSEAHGVNDSGQVVGFSPVIAQLADHALVTGMSSFDSWPFLYNFVSRAFGINNKGQIVGEYLDLVLTRPYQNLTAVLWEEGNMQFLPTLPLYESSRAVAINEGGEAVGWSSYDTESVAALWYDGQVQNLGTLDGDASSRALAINNAGLVVGWSSGTEQSAVVWLDGAMLDLNSLLPKNSGWTLIEAADINDSGMIAGTGLKNGELRAFLLTPPSTAAFANRILHSAKDNKKDKDDKKKK